MYPWKNCYKDELRLKMPYPHEFESVSKLDWLFTVVVSQEILQVFQDDKSVIVCFEEPICLVPVVFPHISKCLRQWEEATNQLSLIEPF